MRSWSLAEELNGGGNGQNSARRTSVESTPARRNGNGRSGGQRGGSRPATQSQAKAIFAIAKSQGLELASLLQERFQVSRPEDLSLKEASQLIDDLKSTQNRRG
jgi:hypothetical protein